MNERTELLMAESYISLKQMNERQARRFRLTTKQVGFTAASFLNDYNPVPYYACKRHLFLCDRNRHNDELWQAHMQMAEFFVMLQRNR